MIELRHLADADHLVSHGPTETRWLVSDQDFLIHAQGPAKTAYTTDARVRLLVVMLQQSSSYSCSEGRETMYYNMKPITPTP